MSIHVKGYLTLRKVIGDQRFSLEETGAITLRDVLLKLYHQKGAEAGKQLYDPENGQIGKAITILVNGRSYTSLPSQLDAKLADGDEIAIFPPMAGGSS